MNPNNWTAKDFIKIRNTSLDNRIKVVGKAITDYIQEDDTAYCRIVSGIDGKFVKVYLAQRGLHQRLMMFGSNNYLGLSTDSRVQAAGINALKTYGGGLCGSPVLNGYTYIQRELEELTANFKKAEDAMVFPSGFAANLAWTKSLPNPKDTVIYDAEAHMSFREGIRGENFQLHRFAHNNIDDLRDSLNDRSNDTYVFVEGLYSMRGDRANITEIYDICRNKNAMLVIDDAHGTGTIGEEGRGVVGELTEKENVLSVGTYSKALGSSGGFVAGDKDLISYLRGVAPSYVFSAALSPANIACASASIRIIEEEKWRVKKLQENAQIANDLFKDLGNVSSEGSPIIFLMFGDRYNVKQLTVDIQEQGFFINAVTFPAVAHNQSGIRITVSALHEKKDLEDLKAAVETAMARQ